MKKFLIVGLGNIGDEYENTRHNIGFKIVDRLAEKHDSRFETKKLGDLASIKIKGRSVSLLKPSTYMNLSGKSLNYWAKELKIDVENILVVTDDIHLDFGVFRLKAKGSAGGHNGLKNISEVLNHQNYARFRFGVSSSFAKGSQADYVLGDWSNQELKDLDYLIEIASDTVESYVFSGIANTMNQYNKHHLKRD